MSSELQLVLVILALLLVLAPALYFVFFSPSAMRRRTLKGQAKADYKNARGTAHLKLLRDAYERLDKKHQQCVGQITATRRRLASLESDQQEELTQTLERHIATQHLRDISGIGSALQERILSTVFRGSLDDLHQAHQVRGVGRRRQRAISNWVRDYQERLPDLVEEDFPGRDDILARHKDAMDELEARIGLLTTRRSKLKQQLDQLRPEIDRLEAVTEKDFVAALQGATDEPDELDTYLQGVFAEWEPIPDWFEDIVLAEVD